MRPKTVVEFGSGTFSTLTFLDRAIFPSVESLVSFENDAVWYEKMKQLVSGDGRASIRQVTGPIASQVGSIAWNTVDLVFVDDSDEFGRAATVRELSKQRISGVAIILHDYEILRLRSATRMFERRYCFKPWNPQTCVLWNGHLSCDRQLNEIDGVLRSHDTLSVEDTASWCRVLSGLSEASYVS
jgi:hypothetical protein